MNILAPEQTFYTLSFSRYCGFGNSDRVTQNSLTHKHRKISSTIFFFKIRINNALVAWLAVSPPLYRTPGAPARLALGRFLSINFNF